MSRHSFFAAPLLALALVAGIVGPTSAHSVKIGSLTITDLWTRATPPKAPTAGGYLTIENAGDAPDRLVAVASPLTGHVELHQMSMKDGTMIMRPAENGIEIPAGQTVTLAPGGFHIMFMGLKSAFAEGEKVPVVLTFEKAGSVETFLHVQAIGSPGPSAGMDHGADEKGAAQ
jgi:periplasmic copper chaperone A